MDPMDIVGKSKEDVSLPKSTMFKIIKEMLPPDVRVARDAQDLLVECCVEFINLLSSESNEVCSREEKKTIAPEHVLKALSDLGFKEYIEEVYTAYEQHKMDTLDSPKAGKFTGVEMTEEEAVAEQQRMFAEARARMNNGAAKPKEPEQEPQQQPQQLAQMQLQMQAPPQHSMQPPLQLHSPQQQYVQPQLQLHQPPQHSFQPQLHVHAQLQQPPQLQQHSLPEQPQPQPPTHLQPQQSPQVQQHPLPGQSSEPQIQPQVQPQQPPQVQQQQPPQVQSDHPPQVQLQHQPAAQPQPQVQTSHAVDS
ncbi:hypothetical protein QOZ80_8BG0657100 [Eleusine coracana subsp. coracana]|nr:hypothetical protein QOZ80_8BG0657100 [Eleusine coracana subsp. coracana]